eukprot:4969875-Amphidinium_carterae.1
MSEPLLTILLLGKDGEDATHHMSSSRNRNCCIRILLEWGIGLTYYPWEGRDEHRQVNGFASCISQKGMCK